MGRSSQKEAKQIRKRSYGLINPLFVIALTADLLTPFLIWKGILPAPTRWISHLAVAIMMICVYPCMVIFGIFPGMVWVVVWVSIVGVAVAVLQGQSLLPTAWGWWLMFQYPLVGLFAYLQPVWPERFPQRLRTFCVFILGMEVIVQIGQYLTGEPPGDNLAGTFGWHGTGNLVLLISFVLCLALGRWLAHQQWTTLAWVLALGGVSSVLAETKLFPIVVLALGLVSLLIYAFRKGRLLRLVPYGVLVATVAFTYVTIYDRTVPGAQGRPLRTFLTNPAVIASYLDRAERQIGVGGYYYDLGRNYALRYGWNMLRSDTPTLLLGFGLGARSESRSLETAGIAMETGKLGLSFGTSLLVIMQELGLLGMVFLGGFIAWTAVNLWRGIRDDPHSDALELRYALLLFSLFWPLWLWYNMAWTLRVPMLLYWTALGYVMGEARGHGDRPVALAGAAGS